MKITHILLVMFLLVGCTPPPALTSTPVNPTRTTAGTHTPAVPTAASGDAAFLPNPVSQPGAINPDVNSGQHPNDYLRQRIHCQDPSARVIH